MADFFAQLTEFSRRILEQLKLPQTGSPWGQERISGPKGAIIHYTADSDMRHVLNWFCNPKDSAHSSPHVVVGDRRYDWADGFDYDLPLVKALPATVVQTRPATSEAWHATWANQSCYGVECINVGELRDQGGVWCWWPQKSAGSAPWTAEWKGDRTPVDLFGRSWQPFTAEQVKAVAMVVREVHLKTPLSPAWIVGHDNVQGTQTPGGQGHDKRDIGPAFPLHALRQAILTGSTAGIDHVFQDPNYAVNHRAQDATQALMSMGRTGDLDAFRRLLPTLERVPRRVFKSILYQLGYLITDSAVEALDLDETASVYIFQRLMGLSPDGVPGPQTLEAAVHRYLDRLAPKAPR